jgi:predicted phosphodiesterase
MRLGIVADIHGNDVALRAVLKDSTRLNLRPLLAGCSADVVIGGHTHVSVLTGQHQPRGFRVSASYTDRRTVPDRIEDPYPGSARRVSR